MRKYDFNPQKYQKELTGIYCEISTLEKVTSKALDKILKKYPKDKNEIFSRDQLIRGFEWMVRENILNENESLKVEELKTQIRMKPTRTISGVTTVTVLTKPFACPGRCVFCPNDVRMPKSYIASEPGAQRALMYRFNPYVQVYNRLKALENIGHPTEKIELLILGGTWSYYPKKYQVWFIKECFRAMNEFSGAIAKTTIPTINDVADISEELKRDFNDELREKVGNKPYNQLLQTPEFKVYIAKFISEDDLSILSLEDLWNELTNQQEINSHGNSRCVGLVLETRPDTITEKEVYDLRKLGATKVQLGIQTLDDEISDLNKRGEHREETSRAFQLLRAGGFKIHAHIMPNLYGATPEIDLEVYKELFDSEQYKPDELKIYPTSIIKNTELYDLWQEGKYIPYTPQQLVDLIADCMEYTPEYCRLTRIIRDIPSTEIEGGNKTTNLRELVEYKLKKENRKNPNIRAREIKDKKVTLDDLFLDILEYKTELTTEYFLQYITKGNSDLDERLIAGFLRLSIPNSQTNIITAELHNSAIIREVHVYGPSLELKKDSTGEAQHLGLGTKLIEKAKEISKEKGFSKLAVISSIGTREYYEKRGFKLQEIYQIVEI